MLCRTLVVKVYVMLDSCNQSICYVGLLYSKYMLCWTLVVKVYVMFDSCSQSICYVGLL